MDIPSKPSELLSVNSFLLELFDKNFQGLEFVSSFGQEAGAAAVLY